jgi:hypothetical protein
MVNIFSNIRFFQTAIIDVLISELNLLTYYADIIIQAGVEKSSPHEAYSRQRSKGESGSRPPPKAEAIIPKS